MALDWTAREKQETREKRATYEPTEWNEVALVGVHHRQGALTIAHVPLAGQLALDHLAERVRLIQELLVVQLAGEHAQHVDTTQGPLT